ncbi:MAG: recombinase family protein [Solirubrobacterales bacterium]
MSGVAKTTTPDSAKSKRAFIYLRVSTDRQAQTDFDNDGYSIKAQREACQRKAKELGAKVIAEFADRGGECPLGRPNRVSGDGREGCRPGRHRFRHRPQG